MKQNYKRNSKSKYKKNRNTHRDLMTNFWLIGRPLKNLDEDEKQNPFVEWR